MPGTPLRDFLEIPYDDLEAVRQGIGSDPRIGWHFLYEGLSKLTADPEFDRWDDEVLVVDLDPQGNATSGFGLNKNQRELCIYNALLGDTDIAEIIEPVEVEHVFVVPATIQLAGAEIELVSALSRENRLKTILEEVADAPAEVLGINDRAQLALAELDRGRRDGAPLGSDCARHPRSAGSGEFT